jgi:GNAT superfamily N-acetyltransferase
VAPRPSSNVQELHVKGLRYLTLATELLQRVRLAHPTAGLWEAADLQWWWRTPRSSDNVEQTLWLDGDGPVAAILLTDWGRNWACDPVFVPDFAGTMLPVIWSHAIKLIESLKLNNVEVAARDDDPALLQLLGESGFAPTEEGSATTWMVAEQRPELVSLPEGFRLLDRTHAGERPHHLVPRNGVEVEARLRQCSLYDPELDLAVEASNGDAAAYGLFWFDPVTSVGLVEPMRTEDRYQRLGLARALLAEGLNRLAARGARRLKVGYVNAAARNLYLSAGFQVTSTSRTYIRRPS